MSNEPSTTERSDKRLPVGDGAAPDKSTSLDGSKIDAALDFWVALARAYAAVAACAAADVARHDLTLGEFGVLEALYHKGPLLLVELQRKQLVSSGGITYLMDRLEQRGLAERRPCQSDRRARYAALTPEGEALVKRTFPRHVAAIQAALAGLDAPEQKQVTESLKRLGHRVESSSSGATPPVVSEGSA